MSINATSDLKAAIESWLNRTDLSDATLATFIQLAHADVRNDVRCRANQSLVVGTVSSYIITVPSDFIEVRSLFVNDKRMQYVDPHTYTEYKSNDWTAGYYTVIGDYIYVLEGDGTAYELVYFAEMESLTADSDTNWVLQHAPNVYLFGSLLHASSYMKHDADEARYAAKYRAAVDSLNQREGTASLGEGMVVRAA